MKEFQHQGHDTKPDQQLVAEAFNHVRQLDLNARQTLSDRNFNRIMGIEPSLELDQLDIYPFEYVSFSEQGLCRNAIVYAHHERHARQTNQVQPFDRTGVSQDIDSADHRVYINLINGSPDFDGDYRAIFSANRKDSRLGDKLPQLSVGQKNRALDNLLKLRDEDLFLPENRLATDLENHQLCESAVASGKKLLADHGVDLATDHQLHSLLFKYGEGMEEYRVILRAKSSTDPNGRVSHQTNFSLQIVNIDRIATINFSEKPGTDQSIKLAFNDARAGNRVYQPPDSLRLKHLAARTIEQLAEQSDKSALDVPREIHGPTSLPHVRIDDIKLLAQSLDPTSY